jgi:hypothetical protein
LEAGRCGTFTIQFKRPAPAELGVIAEIIPDSELICATGAKLPRGGDREKFKRTACTAAPERAKTKKLQQTL